MNSIEPEEAITTERKGYMALIWTHGALFGALVILFAWLVSICS